LINFDLLNTIIKSNIS